MWLRQRTLAAVVLLGMTAATLADIATPVFAGRLVDAVGGGQHDAAWRALVMIGVLGGFMLAVRQLALWGIVRLTLRMMQDVKAEAFARVQAFSASWHAESFSGAVVRQVLRGAGAVDALNDVVAFSLLPGVTVLVGASLLLGLRWPAMGIAVGAGCAAYLAL